MNHFVFSAFLTFLSTLAVGSYFVSRPSGIARLFGFYWLTIAFWSSTVGFQKQLLKIIPDTIWGWLLHLGCVYVPVIFFHFAVRFSKRPIFWAVKLNYLIATTFILLNTFTPFFTHYTAYRDYYAYPIPALFYPLYFIFFAVSVCWGTLLFTKKWETSPPLARKKLLVFLTVHILAYLGAIDNFLIMWDVRIFPLYPFGLYLVSPYAIIGGWALSSLLAPSD